MKNKSKEFFLILKGNYTIVKISINDILKVQIAEKNNSHYIKIVLNNSKNIVIFCDNRINSDIDKLFNIIFKKIYEAIEYNKESVSIYNRYKDKIIFTFDVNI